MTALRHPSARCAPYPCGRRAPPRCGVGGFRGERPLISPLLKMCGPRVLLRRAGYSKEMAISGTRRRPGETSHEMGRKGSHWAENALTVLWARNQKLSENEFDTAETGCHPAVRTSHRTPFERTWKHRVNMSKRSTGKTMVRRSARADGQRTGSRSPGPFERRSRRIPGGSDSRRPFVNGDR